MATRAKKAVRTPTAQDRQFGRHVRSLRRARGLTQEQLAERSTLSPDTIRRLEYGSFSPTHDTLRKLCHGLRVRVSTLFLGLELAERDIPREFTDLVSTMDPAELDTLIRAVHSLLAVLAAGSKHDDD